MMKRMLNLLITLVLMVTLLTSCASPMKAYKKTIGEKDIEGKIEGIQNQVNVVLEVANSIESESEDSQQFIDSYTQVITEVERLADLVNEAKTVTEDIDLSDDEVNEINKYLIEGLEVYTDMANTVKASAQVLKDITILSEDVMTAYTEFMTLLFSDDIPSEAFITAFTMMITEYQDEIAFVTDGMFAMIESGDVDVEQIQNVEVSINEAKTLILETEPVNEIDQVYKDTILIFIEGMQELMTLSVDNQVIIQKVSAYDSIVDYIEEVDEEAVRSIEEWKAALVE